MNRRCALIVFWLVFTTAVLEAQSKRKPLVLRLEFIPQENVSQVSPTMDPRLLARALTVLPTVDGRETDKSLIGENRESERRPREIRTHSNVAAFVDLTLRQCLKEWGIRLQDKADLVLTGELVRLFVMERNTYSAEARVRFRLQDSAGQLLWEGIMSGEATRWGRSLSRDNYNEVISDSLKKAYSALLSDKAFQAAWPGRPEEAADEPGMPPAILKQKVLGLMKENVSTGVILGYVRAQRVSPPMSAEDIVDWKRSGIDESVVEAAVGAAPDSR